MPLDLDLLKNKLRQEEIMQLNRKQFVRFFMRLALFLAAEAFLLFYVVGGAVVSQTSMYPEVQDGDFVLYNRLSRTFNPGTIVVIRGNDSGIYYIKRVIATEGDVVALTPEGGVEVNGVLLDEPYVQHAPTTEHDVPFPQTVPPGHFFVLGDNRLVSKDSRNREMGMIPRDHINGTLLFSVRGQQRGEYGSFE